MKKPIYFTIAIAILLGLSIAALEKFTTYTPSVNIHTDAPVLTKKSIIINASPETVWTIMSKVNNWSSWQRDISNPKLIGNFSQGQSFTWSSGGLNIRSTIHFAVPFKKIGWSGPAFGSFAIHNWTFSSLPNGRTRVDVEESMEGWLVKLFAGKVQSSLEKSLDTWLEDLKTESEKTKSTIR